MSTAVQDRDAIISKAIEIASAEEREAYLAQACGNDAVLRQQVEEMVAAHFLTGSPDKPVRAADHGTVSARRDQEQAGVSEVEVHARPPRSSGWLGKWRPKHPRAIAATVALLLLAIAAGGFSLAGWAWREEEQARTAAQQAVEESMQARKAEEEAKHQRDQALAAVQAVTKERDQALTLEKEARLSEQDTKAVLDFIQNKVLSVSRPEVWINGQGKNVTLRQAVESAEALVAKTFSDRPLAEALVHEILGSTYLDLGEATQAVKQFERALALREGLLGSGHPDTSGCRNRLAVAYRLAGRTDEASRLFNTR